MAIEELITPILDIGTLTMQMLGFPFGEDMPWSEEVEPVQYTLPVFQMEFKVTPKLFLFQFWCVSTFCIVFCILCLGDVHENLMDRIASTMNDSTYEDEEEAERTKQKQILASSEDEITVSPLSPSSPSSPTVTQEEEQFLRQNNDAIAACKRLVPVGGEATEGILTLTKIYFPDSSLAGATTSPEVRIFSFLRDFGLLSNATTFQTILSVYRGANIENVKISNTTNDNPGQDTAHAGSLVKILFLFQSLRDMAIAPFPSFASPSEVFELHILPLVAARRKDKTSPSKLLEQEISSIHASLAATESAFAAAISSDRFSPKMQMKELQTIKAREIKRAHDRTLTDITQFDVDRLREQVSSAFISSPPPPILLTPHAVRQEDGHSA